MDNYCDIVNKIIIMHKFYLISVFLLFLVTGQAQTFEMRFTKILDDPLSGRKYPSRGPVIMQTKSSLLRMQSFQCSNQVPSKVSPSPKKKNGYNTRSMLKKVVPISSFKLEEEDSAQDRKKKRKLRRSHITKKLNWDGRLLRKSKKLSAGAASASAGADACGKSKGKGVAAFVEKKKDGFMKVFNRL